MQEILKVVAGKTIIDQTDGVRSKERRAVIYALSLMEAEIDALEWLLRGLTNQRKGGAG